MMSPVTRLLFVDALRTYSFSGVEVVSALEGLGCEIESQGQIKRFSYTDIEDLVVQLTFDPAGELSCITICALVEDDAAGWSGWTRDLEKRRFELQDQWLSKIGINKSEEPPLRIANQFSQQEGASVITITKLA